MRRTAPLLLAAALLAVTAPVATADPTAEVGPGSVDPGGDVTVSVSCDPLDGSAPETLDAVSQAFADGTVRLARVPGDDEGTAGPAYRGTARIAPAADLEGRTQPGGVGPDSAWTVDGTCPAPPGGRGTPWSATFDVSRDGAAAGSNADDSTYGDGGDGSAYGDGSAGGAGGAGSVHADGGGAGGDGSVHADGGGGAGDQPCTSSHGSPCGDGTGAGAGVQPCTPSHGSSCESTGRPCPEPRQTHGGAPHDTAPHDTSCAPATVEHGVRAGSGGTFTDSVPTLVAGGLLIAGAFGAAAHRLLVRRRPAGDA